MVRRRRRRAFTLAEMLTVIAIIVALIAILLPIISAAWEHARQVRCLSNIRQVTQAYLEYSAESENYLLPLDSSGAQVGYGSPQDDNQVIPAINRYLRSTPVFHCPSDPRERSLSYGINDFLAGSWAGYMHQNMRPLKRLLDARNGAGTFAVIEETDFYPKATGDSGGFVVVPNPSFTWIDAPAAPHQRRTCISFLDGHAEVWGWQDARTPELAAKHYVRTLNNPDLIRLENALGSR